MSTRPWRLRSGDNVEFVWNNPVSQNKEYRRGIVRSIDWYKIPPPGLHKRNIEGPVYLLTIHDLDRDGAFRSFPLTEIAPVI